MHLAHVTLCSHSNMLLFLLLLTLIQMKSICQRRPTQTAHYVFKEQVTVSVCVCVNMPLTTLVSS